MTESWRRLLHRWFVQYNPLYLLSAALVLRGVNLISSELLSAGHVYGELGGPAVAELYSWALIGGAALLLRVGLRRPAVMLSLLAVLYQGDLTLHTETCAYLGWIGWLASSVWLASFVLKLVALVRAMSLRATRSALLVPTFGATGLVLVPRLVQHADPHAASMLVGSWIFALFVLGLWTSRRVETRWTLDAWGQTVLRRSLAATWALWAALASLHVLFWFSTRRLEPAVLIPVTLLLLTRFIRREAWVWTTVGGALLLVAWTSPAFLSFAGALCALTLAMHAARNVVARKGVELPIVGLVSCVYLAVWTAGWSGGPWPPHVLWLDGAFALAVLLSVWQLRARAALLPLGATVAHYTVQARVVTAPVTGLEWGVWFASVGFVLLAATIGGSVAFHLRFTDAGDAQRERWPPRA